MSDAPTPDGRAPVIAAVQAAFDFLFANFAAFARVSAVWVALGVGVSIVLFGGVSPGSAQALWMQNLSPTVLNALLHIPAIVIAFGGGIVVAVSWHRFILLGEAPPWTPMLLAAHVRYTGRFIAMFGIYLVISALLLAVGTMMLGRLVRFFPELGAVLSYFPLIAYGAFVALVARTGVALPGAAISDGYWTLEKSWHATDGQTLRLFLGAFAIQIPFFVLEQFTSAGAQMLGLTDDGVMYAAFAADSFIRLAGVAVGAAYLSYLFTHFEAQRHAGGGA